MSALCKCLIALFAIMVILHHCSGAKHHTEALTQEESLSQAIQNMSSHDSSKTIGSQQADPLLASFYSNPSDQVNVPDPMKVASTVAQRDAITGLAATPGDAQASAQYAQRLESDMKQTTFNVNDFLPQDINNTWFQTDVNNARNNVDQATLIDVAKFCQGVDTIGQSLKNPSYDIRGNIPNPKIVVSPFLNSSYDPDTNIKSWCS